MIIRTLNIILASVLAFILASPVQAERAFYSAFSLVPGTTALGNLILTGADPNTSILTNSSAKRLLLYGGDALTNTHGNIGINGSTFSGAAGDIAIAAGSVTNGDVTIAAPHSTGIINLATTGLAITRFSVIANGDFSQDATNGGDIVFARANRGVRNTVSSGASAAGTTSADATVMTSAYNNIGIVGAGQGVRFQGFPIGMTVAVRNGGANILKVYPPTGGAILGYGTDVGADLAVNATMWCWVNTVVTQLVCSEAPNA